MKKITDMNIIEEIKNQHNQIPKQYTEAQNDAVKGFILSVYSLFGQKSSNCSQTDNLSIAMRTYANDILSLSGSERQERLYRIKKLKQAGHVKYQWPEEALSHGCAEHSFFILDYHSFYPPSPDVIGNRNKEERLRLQGIPADKETAKQHIKNLKGLFS